MDSMRSILTNDPKRVIDWVCARTGGANLGTHATAIGLLSDGELVAGVMYDNYHRASIAMHIAGEGPHWLTREFLRVAFDYPFRQLGVFKVCGIVDSGNEAAMRFDKHLGFVEEGRIRGACKNGCDLVFLSMTAEQCRWLQLPMPERKAA